MGIPLKGFVKNYTEFFFFCWFHYWDINDNILISLGYDQALWLCRFEVQVVWQCPVVYYVKIVIKFWTTVIYSILFTIHIYLYIICLPCSTTLDTDMGVDTLTYIFSHVFKSCTSFVLSNCANDKNVYMFSLVISHKPLYHCIIQQCMLVVHNFHVKIRYTYTNFFICFSKVVSVSCYQIVWMPKQITFGIRNTQYIIAVTVHKHPSVFNTTNTIQSRVNCPNNLIGAKCS